MTLITSNSTCSINPYLHAQYVFTLSDATKIILVQTPSGSPVYYKSTDGGVSWGTPLPLLANLKLQNAFYIGINGSSLYIWYIGTDGIHAYQASWDSIGKTFTTPILDSLVLPRTGVTTADASFYNNTWHIIYVLGSEVNIFASSNAMTVDFYGNSVFSASTWQYVSIVATASTVYVSAASSSQGKTYLMPVSYTSTYSWIPAAQEQAIQYSANHTLLLNSQNMVELIYSFSSTLYYKLRLGPLSYGGSAYIDVQNPSDTRFSATYDTVTGNLFIYYDSVSNYPTGEIYTSQRLTGKWQPVTRIAGQSSAGYTNVSSSPQLINGSIDLLYTVGVGGTSACSIWYEKVPVSLAPLQPTNLAPNNTTAQGNPLLSWTYKNTSPYDIQGSYQVQLFDPSNNMLWDSGQVVSSSSTATPYLNLGQTIPTTTLSPGTYHWQVRTTDAQTGIFGPWSNQATFIVTAAASLTIEGFSANGVAVSATPAILGSPSLDNVSFSWFSTNGNMGQSYRLMLYDTANIQKGVNGFNALITPLHPGGTLVGNPNSTHLLLQAGTATTVGDGWLALVGQQLEVQGGGNTSLVTINSIPTGTVLSQSSTTTSTLSLSTSDAAQFVVGDTITVGPNVLPQGRTIPYPAQHESGTINSISGSSLTFSVPFTIDHTGHTIKANRVTVSTLSHTYTNTATYKGYFTTPPWTIRQLQSGQTYYLIVQVQDSLGLQTTAPWWTLSAQWVAPTPVTNVTWNSDPTTGAFTLTWTNPPGATTISVLKALTGSNEWTVISEGTLRTSITDMPRLGVSYDYQIVAYVAYQ